MPKQPDLTAAMKRLIELEGAVKLPWTEVKSFDPRCYELAEYFAPNAPKEFLKELAGEIQQAVEDFGLPDVCSREPGHDGPCNGYPSDTCRI